MLHGRNRPLTPQPYTWVSLCRKFHHGTFKNNRTLGLNDFPNLSQHRGIRKLSSKPSGDLRVDAHGLQSCLDAEERCGNCSPQGARFMVTKTVLQGNLGDRLWKFSRNPAVPQSSGAEVLLNPLPLRHSYHDNNIWYTITMTIANLTTIVISW